MHTKFTPENQDEFEFRLELTMTLGEWKRLKAQLNNLSWPSSDLSREINSMISQAERSFYPASEEQ